MSYQRHGGTRTRDRAEPRGITTRTRQGPTGGIRIGGVPRRKPRHAGVAKIWKGEKDRLSFNLPRTFRNITLPCSLVFNRDDIGHSVSGREASSSLLVLIGQSLTGLSNSPCDLFITSSSSFPPTVRLVDCPLPLGSTCTRSYLVVSRCPCTTRLVSILRTTGLTHPGSYTDGDRLF